MEGPATTDMETTHMSRFARHARAHEAAAKQLRTDAAQYRKTGDTSTAARLEKRAKEQDERVKYYRDGR